MARNKIRMAALGRDFQVGDLYDYRNDSILPDIVLYYDEKSDLMTNPKSILELRCEDSKSPKWKLMRLHEHLKTSTMADLIGKYKGASNYLSDRTSSSQATKVLVLQVQSTEKSVELKDFSPNEVLHHFKERKVTHVVSSVTYGAEAYCVLIQDLDKELDEEEAQEEAETNLKDLANKLEDALKENQDWTELRNQLDEKENRVKCRLYADLQTQAVKDCNAIEAYKQLVLLKEIQYTEAEESKAVPIEIELCPLKVILGLRVPDKEIPLHIQYRDVDSEVVDRCCKFLAKLEKIYCEAEAIRSTANRTSKTSLRLFVETVNKFQDVLKTNLKDGVLAARENADGDDKLRETIDKIEKHPLFKPSRLNRWLTFKKAESEMLERINKTKKRIPLFASEKLLLDELAGADQKYALVLRIPSLEHRTQEILQQMKELVKDGRRWLKLAKNSEEDEDRSEDEGKDDPWHMIQRKRKPVLDKIRELAEYAEKNKHLADQVQFLMVIDDHQERNVKETGRYCVYEYDTVLKDNITQLPRPPVGLKIQVQKATSVKVGWSDESLGYPCHYLVEYRLSNGSESWTQKKTTKPGENQMTIPFKKGSVMEIRVAADTCIGRSEFSDVIDTELDDTETSQTTADISCNESESEEVETPKVTPRKPGFPASPTSPIMLEDESELVRPNEKKARPKKPIDFTAMLSFKGIDRNECIEIAALGRRLGLCQLYDYRSDRPADDVLDFEYSLQVDEVYDLKLNIADSESTSDKWEFLGLDDHLKASTVSGIIDKYTGASNYLNEKPNPSQVTRVLFLRAVTKKERLNLPSPVDYALVQSSAAQSSTHIVVGVTYGFQAYCVIHQNLENERERERTEEELHMLVEELKKALNEREDWTNFQDKLDREERRRLARTKCRLYADLQTQTVRQCNVSDMYRHFLLLKEAVQQTNDGQSRAVPISISLCPLKHVIGRVKGAEKLLHYRDVDVDLVFRCCRLWSDLECITNEAMTFSAAANKSNKLSIGRFTEAIGKFSSLFRNDLKFAISRARGSEEGDDDELANVIDAAENHPLFKPSGLKRWLNYKRHESEMAESMGEIEGIIVLPDKKEVENELSTSFDLKYALVMWIPPLNGKTNEILQAMRHYVESQTRVVPIMSDKDDEFSDEPWHMEQRRRSQIEDKIRKFAEHAVKNRSIENQIQFIVAFGESNVKKLGWRYSVYEAEKMLKDNLDQLPGPPTNLRIQLATSGPTRNTKTSSSLCVSWDYEDLGYPYHFLVEYRTKCVSGDPWTQQRTLKAGETQWTINVPTGSATEVRVAADTCIGRSEFSQVVDTESLDFGADENSRAQSLQQPEKQAKSRANVSPTQASQEESPITNRQQQGQKYYDNQAAIRKEMIQPRIQHETPFSSTSAETLKSHSLKPTPFSSRLMETTHQPVHTSSVRLSQSTTTRTTKAETQPSSSNASRGSGAQTAPRQELSQGQPTPPSPVPRSNVPAVAEHLKQMFAPRKKAAANVRFAESIKGQCTRIGQHDGMDLYSVPLKKTGDIGTITERYSFSGADGSKMLRKTILVMGATGSGKTSLINGMINYIFDVKWEDPFRFQLIQEQEVGQSQAHSQTRKITAYDIFHCPGFRVPFSLTIVDTPGYGDTKGLDRDQEITEMVHQFFKDQGGIQELDVVGFVVPASLTRLTVTQDYIFDSMLSIFGNDVKENASFLLTFADSQDPPVLTAITESNLGCLVDAESGNPMHHKFNNSGFFCSNRQTGKTTDRFNNFFWQMGMDNFEKFFNVLIKMRSKSLSLTKEVLEERKQLEATVDGLQPLIKIALQKMEEMKKLKKTVVDNQEHIKANNIVEFDFEATVPVQVKVPSGTFGTNCNSCKVTCHYPCSQDNNGGEVNCSVMDKSMPEAARRCTVCPEKCLWTHHSNQPCKWEYVQRKQPTTSKDLKSTYESQTNTKMTTTGLIESLEDTIRENEQALLEKVETVTKCIQRLDKIALRPNPFSTPQYIDLIIDAEKWEKFPGFEERITSLKQLRRMAEIQNQIQNNAPLNEIIQGGMKKS